jgi:hypothetical protein
LFVAIVSVVDVVAVTTFWIALGAVDLERPVTLMVTGAAREARLSVVQTRRVPRVSKDS